MWKKYVQYVIRSSAKPNATPNCTTNALGYYRRSSRDALSAANPNHYHLEKGNGPPSLSLQPTLRFGEQNQFRVFYEIDPEHRHVDILAIGVKHGNRLVIGAEEVEL